MSAPVRARLLSVTEKGYIMKNYWYKDYFVMLECQHNGSILAVASNDTNRIKQVFYGYTMPQIKVEIRSLIAEA